MFTLMGNCVAHCKQKGEKKATFVVCGLDNAGKTTITKALQGKIERETRPTVGVRFDNKWEAGKFKLEVFDLGGGAKIRKIWDSYYAEVHGAIYVIDSADEARLAESKECLAAMVADPHLAGKPLLVFANKQDLAGALAASELSDKMGLHEDGFRECSHNIFACTALTAEGGSIDGQLQAGMKWLLGAGTKNLDAVNARIAKEMAVEKEKNRLIREKKRAEVEIMKAERKRKADEEEAAAAAQAEEQRSLAAAAGGEGGVAGSFNPIAAPEPQPHVWSTDADNEPAPQAGAGAGADDVVALPQHFAAEEPAGVASPQTVPSSPGNGDFYLPGMQTFPDRPPKGGALPPLKSSRAETEADVKPEPTPEP